MSEPISQMPEANPLDGSELLHVVQDGDNRRIPSDTYGLRHMQDAYQQHGALGDNSTDDTAAIKAARDASSGEAVRLPMTPGGGLYRTTSGINMGQIPLVMDPGVEIRAEGTDVAIAIDGAVRGDSFIRVRRVNADTAYWYDGGESTSVGVQIRNSSDTYTRIPFCINFDTGVELLGDGTGCVDNELSIGEVRDCRVNFATRVINSGWSAQHKAIIGSLSLASTHADIAGTRHALLDGAATTIIGANMEGGNPELTLECNGSENQFINCRWEGLAAGDAQLNGDRNIVFGGKGNYGPDPSDLIQPFADNGVDNLIVGTNSTRFSGMYASGSITVGGYRDAVLGRGANANAGIGATAVGLDADASGSGANTAIGREARADVSAAALGFRASATDNGLAGGHNASAGAQEATALGPDASAGSVRSTALGKGATADAVDQVMLGTSARTVVSPGVFEHRGGSVGFFGAAVVSQQTAPAALTDNSGGTTDSTVEAVSGSGADAAINNNFAELAQDVDELRTALVNLGLIA